MKFLDRLIKDYKISAILIIVGLCVEIITLIWIHHIAFITFAIVSLLCICLGMFLFIFKVLSKPKA